MAIIDSYSEPTHSPIFGGDLPIGEPIVADSMVHQMPIEYDDFVWRLWVDLWCLIDAPLNTNTDSKMPSCYAEMGWSEHSQAGPEVKDIMLSKLIPMEWHPHWNQ